MQYFKLLTAFMAVAGICSLSSCEDDNNIGSSISKGEVAIVVDSVFTVSGNSVRNEQFDSRSKTLLLGRIAADDFGTLDCSYAARLMPAASLNIPDTIPVDDISGMKLKFEYVKKSLVGDSLAPQQLSVYRLSRQLPADINNLTDLSGFYDVSQPLGVKTFTAASLGQASSVYNSKNGVVSIPLDKSFAQEVVAEYRRDPSIFSRPEHFAERFAGIYVRSTFGRGLIINMASTEFTTYYNYTRQVTVIKDGVSTKVDSLFTDSTTLFSISPEVLSANLSRLTPAQSLISRIYQGECVVQSPGGYNVKVRFPADQIIDRYYNEDFNLSVVNSLSMEVPAIAINNDYGFTFPPYLLMIKTARLEEFFLNNELPEEEDTECFYASYDSSSRSYTFNGLRPYILALMKNGGSVAEEDMDFTIVPVNITTELVGVSPNQKTVVTECAYYMTRPTLCALDVKNAKVKFTYSRQYMK